MDTKITPAEQRIVDALRTHNLTNMPTQQAISHAIGKTLGLKEGTIARYITALKRRGVVDEQCVPVAASQAEVETNRVAELFAGFVRSDVVRIARHLSDDVNDLVFSAMQSDNDISARTLICRLYTLTDAANSELNEQLERLKQLTIAGN